ncbi:MAG: hypothetical protein HPY69_12550 [Armatimonadetes bacterium]|nr:hypothetical protein [Armatimonadota bacterium]
MRQITLSLLVVLAGVALAAPGCAQGLPELPDLTADERAALPQGDYTPAQSWEAEVAPHLTGRVVQDLEASGGNALEATPGRDKPDTLLFGPYLELEPGNYVAFFRVKLLEPLEDGVALRLDACVEYAQQFLGARELAAPDLVVGRYAELAVGFQYPGGKLECRATWPGEAALRADRVSLYRVTGGDFTRTGWRVPEAKPSGLPRDLAYIPVERPFPDVFPRSGPPAEELLIADLRSERQDMRLLMYCLQGLVNRSQPRLYCISHDMDAFWLEQMTQRGFVARTKPMAQPRDLLQQFRDVYQGLIITDPALPASKNVATMLASVRDGLAVSPRLARELDLPVLEDLRGRWTTSAEAYRWAFDHLWPELNHFVVACSWPDHLGLRDYLVQHKVFIFWLSGPLDGARKYASPDAEVRLMEELLAQMPANIPVMSYPWAGKDVGIGEGPGVSLFAEFGKYLVGSIDTTNLSVHSGLRLPEPRQQPAPPAPALDPTKVYLSVIISDGDNLPVLKVNNFPQLWQDPLRGQFPIGWTLCPAAHVLLPDLVDYYFRTATPQDAFLGAVSGVGYTYPDLYGKRFRDGDRQRVYDGFLDQTAEYMRRSDLRELWIMNATRPEVIARFAERIPELDALFPDYGRRVLSGAEATHATARNVPVFHAIGRWAEGLKREQQIANLVAEIQEMTPRQRPAFLHFFVLNWFADLPLLQEVLQRLGPDYVAVRPDHLAQLWHEDARQRQVDLTLPPTAAYLEGQPLRLQGTLRNLTDQALSVSLTLQGAGEAATIAPEQVELGPAEETSVIVGGVPTEKLATIACSGLFGTRTTELQLTPIAASDIIGEVGTLGALSPALYLEAEALAHRSGREAGDAAASGGKFWSAQKGQAEPGYIVYGPYQPLEAGSYLALFRLRRDDPGDGLLAQVDTCVGGGSPQTGLRDVRSDELPEGQFRWVAVPFTHPGGPFESRVLWSDAASLAVDAIAVWRVHER